MLSKKEKKRLKLEKLRRQSELGRQEFEQKRDNEVKQQEQSTSKKFRMYMILGIIIIVAVASIGTFAFINSSKPGNYDEFANCLTEKGAVMYGASWCKYTTQQKGMFGKSFKFIDYRDFSKNPDVKITPTWYIGDEKLERVQSFDKLAQATGCVIS